MTRQAAIRSRTSRPRAVVRAGRASGPGVLFAGLAGLAGLVFQIVRGGAQNGAAAGSAAQPVSVRPAGDHDLRLEALELRVSELARAVEGLALLPSGGTLRSAVDDEPADAAGQAAAAQASAALERRLAALEDSLGAPGGELASRGRATQTAREEPDVSESQRRALDATLSDAERVRELGVLRFRKDQLGNDARSPEVVAAMIAIAQVSADEELRADIWRQLHRSGDPALRDPLLWSLQYDPSADVRSEAAETLDDFNSDPAVAAALRHAAEHDPDRSVRKEASGSL